MAGKSAADFLRSFDQFMVEAIGYPAGGAPVAFRALLQDAGVETRMGLISAVEPTITFATAHCPELAPGDEVEINGVCYKVREGGDFKDATARRFRIREAA